MMIRFSHDFNVHASRFLPTLAFVAVCIPALAQHAGESLYAQRCAQCHDNGNAGARAPSRSVLQSMPFDAVVRSLTTGTMGLITQDWTDADRAAVASFVTGKTADAPSAADNAAGQCAQDHASLRLDGPRWNGWGVDLANSRFQPAEMAGITKATVSRLQLKWAFGFPGATVVNAQPTVVGGWLFVAGADLKVYALDAKSGCTRWAFPTEARVRTAISVAPITGTDQIAIYFGDVRAYILSIEPPAYPFAVDATKAARALKTLASPKKAGKAER